MNARRDHEGKVDDNQTRFMIVVGERLSLLSSDRRFVTMRVLDPHSLDTSESTQKYCGSCEHVCGVSSKLAGRRTASIAYAIPQNTSLQTRQKEYGQNFTFLTACSINDELRARSSTSKQSLIRKFPLPLQGRKRPSSL